MCRWRRPTMRRIAPCRSAGSACWRGRRDSVRPEAVQPLGFAAIKPFSSEQLDLTAGERRPVLLLNPATAVDSPNLALERGKQPHDRMTMIGAADRALVKEQS